MKNLRTIFATVVAGALAFSLSACGEAPKSAKPQEDKPVVTEISLKSIAKACRLHISNNNGMKEIAMGMDSSGVEIEKDFYYKKALCVASIMAPDGVDYKKAFKSMRAKENTKDADHSVFFRKDGFEVGFYAIGEKENGGTARRYFELYNAKDRDNYLKNLFNTPKTTGDGSDHNDTND